MFFIFKKDDNFRCCIDYKELNAFIIKNQCLFSLIDKILNRFMNVVYFIKFDFKNPYHRIKIYKNSE